jgi:hypothetical protein
MNDEHWATAIKVAAVAVAAPRWIGALLEAEGVPLPTEWRGWWVTHAPHKTACGAVQVSSQRCVQRGWPW